jgi:glycerol uptake facilitator protein
LSNIISEVIGTFVLLFVIFYFTKGELGAEKTPIGLGSLGALPVSLLVWAIGLSLGGTTGYAINPARDLGPRIMHAILPIPEKGSSGWDYAWVPVVGANYWLGSSCRTIFMFKVIKINEQQVL